MFNRVHYSFQFPNACSRCAANPPSAEWDIGTTQGNRKYHIKVPICKDCLRYLRRAQILGWVTTVAVAFPAFLLIPSIVNNSDGMLWACGAGPMIGLAAGLIVRHACADFGFAKLEYKRNNPTIRFKNRRYDKAFQQMNRFGAMRH